MNTPCRVTIDERNHQTWLEQQEECVDTHNCHKTSKELQARIDLNWIKLMAKMARETDGSMK